MPETVAKTRRGEGAQVRRCIAVNECISRWMFKGQRTQCVINPALSQEARAKEALRRADVAKRVLIVGAGPAGCEAAIVAAERGHEVTVIEREPELGGQMRAWSAASFLNTEMANMINFYRVELERLGVDVRLGVEATQSDLASYDAVLLATGTRTSGLPEGAIDAVDMLTTKDLPDGGHVTVHGDTEIAMFAALWLAEQGRGVTLSSPSDDVGLDTNDMQRARFAQLLAAAGVETVTGQTAQAGGVVGGPRTALPATCSRTKSTTRKSVRSEPERVVAGCMRPPQSGFRAAAEI